MIKIVVAGAAGRMGRAVLQAIADDAELELVGAAGLRAGLDTGELIGKGKSGIVTECDLKALLERTKPDVMVDFTTPSSVFSNVMTALDCGVSPVIGTTGLTADNKKLIHDKALSTKTPAFLAANFAIGAVLLMMACKKIAQYMPNVEIIEMHHDKKLDAPSGTAITTAEMISEVRKPMRQGHPDSKETLSGARGAELNGIPIHSVRLPGYVAHQEVIFGGLGQTLSIRHDSIDRVSFMPGVVLACKKVRNLVGLVENLDKIL